jgi:hypothetical protein
MAKQIPPDVLTLQRTQPIQGKPVDVQIFWNERFCGHINLPFAAWIKLNRLLSHGVAMDKKEEGKLNVKVKVEGLNAEPAMELVPEKVKPQRPAPVPYPYRGGISNLAAEEEDEDIKAAERQAKLDEIATAETAKTEAANEQLVRSLRPESEGE